MSTIKDELRFSVWDGAGVVIYDSSDFASIMQNVNYSEAPLFSIGDLIFVNGVKRKITKIGIGTYPEIRQVQVVVHVD